ncbi:MAG TPA: response regulator [Candidatus Dormibacteraeota bacterium]|nr:response regulator [Candidatus Dormibacteraeota bacterium]
MARSETLVLVVDDSDDVRDVLAFLLSTAGFAVETAADGAEALTVMHAVRPCIVVLDLVMPNVSGREFRRVQLSEPAVRDIPVIVYSAAADVREAAAEMGAAYVEKTGEIGDLLQAIRRHCLT